MLKISKLWMVLLDGQQQKQPEFNLAGKIQRK